MEKVLRDPDLKYYRGKFAKPSISINKPYNCASFQRESGDSTNNISGVEPGDTL
jgi:hypothetical protein